MNFSRRSPTLTNSMTRYHFDEIKEILFYIDKAICDEQDKQKKRSYIGGSSLGSLCTRQVQYRYMQTKPDTDKEFSARTLRIFEMGHIIEDIVANYFRKAGFDIKTHDKNGEQFGFSVADGQIQGHIDGVICDGPVDVKYPFLWENKSSNNRKFNEFIRKGVALTQPIYAAQLAIYQAYMDLTDNPALFTVYNKDTSDLYFEFVPFDRGLAQSISDKGANIIKATNANDMLPRVAVNSDFHTCRYCEFRKTCWEIKGLDE